MSDNLELWNAVSRVPPEHLKGFTRGGGFKGTAIKPMWSIKAMTEHFGPCGQGWGVHEPKFTIHPAGVETLVFCTVGVWYKDNAPIYGVGGDKVVAQFSSGIKPDDEAFKKAYTDALTNALKLLGVGADIHMGLWDGNKYVDEPKDEKPAMTFGNPFGLALYDKSRANVTDEPDIDFKEIADGLIALVAACTTSAELAELKASERFVSEQNSLPDAQFQKLVTAYKNKKAALMPKVA